ncbi:hypothetical protein F5X99DRAFT_371275 [Biscogniauxia marginata]|nr:hypothetical protein F5X99DRAFT_371275 [Biscogniauxia marginata]
MRFQSLFIALALCAISNASWFRRDIALYSAKTPRAIFLTPSSLDAARALKITNKDTRTTTSKRDDDDDDDSDDDDDNDGNNQRGPNSGAIAGGVIGGLLLLLLLILGTWYWYRVGPRRPNRRRSRFRFRRTGSSRGKDKEDNDAESQYRYKSHEPPHKAPTLPSQPTSDSASALILRPAGPQLPPPTPPAAELEASIHHSMSPSPISEDHHTPLRPAPALAARPGWSV